MKDFSRTNEKRRKIPRALIIAGVAVICLALAAAGFFVGRKIAAKIRGSSVATDTDPGWNAPSYVAYKPLVVNEYSRPGTALEKINAVVVHYVGNPGTTAEQNRSYFAGLAVSGATWASSHFIVGLDGEVLGIDRFGQSAPYKILFKEYGFTGENVAAILPVAADRPPVRVLFRLPLLHHVHDLNRQGDKPVGCI